MIEKLAPEISTRKSTRAAVYVLLALFVLSDVALFSTRAVYIDEHIFLSVAGAPRDWVFPNNTEWLFFGTMYPLASHTHPPLGAYVLAMFYRVFGGFHEIPFRILFSIFGMIAAISFYSLARRFTDHPLEVTLLFLVSPAFFVLCQTLMMDVPMLAMLLAGFALYLRHCDGEARALVPAAICFILAAGFGYTALVPLGTLFLCAVAFRRPKSDLIAIAAAPAALTVWLALMTLYSGQLPIARTVEYMASHGSSAHNMLATPSFLGGVTLLPWSFLLLADVRNRKVVVVSSLIAAGALSVFIKWLTPWYGLWFILLASSGVALILLFAVKTVSRLMAGFKDWRHFLALWFPATLAFFIVVGEMMNARYLLLAMPPLYLVLFQNSGRSKLRAVTVATLVLTLAVAAADYNFVNSYREWVSQTIVPLQEQGFKVWSAAESGLRFYLEQRGISTLATSDLRPSGGNLIVRHSGVFRYSLSPDVETMLMVVKTFDLQSGFPVRTFNDTAGAGFYDSHMGIVPFTFSRAAMDRLEVAQVSPFVQSLPLPANGNKPIPAWSPAGPILKQVEPELEYTIPLPRNTRLEYEIEGAGTMERTDSRVRLRKGNTEAVVWKNFRIVPLQFLSQ